MNLHTVQDSTIYVPNTFFVLSKDNDWFYRWHSFREINVDTLDKALTLLIRCSLNSTRIITEQNSITLQFEQSRQSWGCLEIYYTIFNYNGMLKLRLLRDNANWLFLGSVSNLVICFLTMWFNAMISVRCRQLLIFSLARVTIAAVPRRYRGRFRRLLSVTIAWFESASK